MDIKHLKNRAAQAETTLRMARQGQEPMELVIEYVAPAGRGPNDLGDAEEWQTVQQQRENPSPLPPGCLLREIVADPFVEYEHRHNLPPGALAEHPQRGEVPFADLLALAGCTESHKIGRFCGKSR